MSQILQPYEQFLSSSELSNDQIINDLFYSLEKLNEIFTSISSRIYKRIEDEDNRIMMVNNRITTCHNKVQSVRGSNKATTVHSTAKFPAGKSLPPPSTLFSTFIQVNYL
jgi:hypothetical protein